MREYHIAGRLAPVIFKDTVDSTNTALKELARAGAMSGTVLIARRQTGGRGRLGRSFESPPEGLYLSMLRKTVCPPERTLTTTPMAAVAVCRTAEAVCGLSPEIKWPNDVLLGAKKLCGILTELSVQSGEATLVLGIGVNVNTPEESFSPALRDTACSIYGQTGCKTDMAAFARRLIAELDELFSLWEADSRAFLAEYRRRCSTPGQDILILQNEKSRPARAVGINEDMSLQIIGENGAEALRFGEISIRPAPVKDF